MLQLFVCCFFFCNLWGRHACPRSDAFEAIKVTKISTMSTHPFHTGLLFRTRIVQTSGKKNKPKNAKYLKDFLHPRIKNQIFQKKCTIHYKSNKKYQKSIRGHPKNLRHSKVDVMATVCVQIFNPSPEPRL